MMSSLFLNQYPDNGTSYRVGPYDVHFLDKFTRSLFSYLPGPTYPSFVILNSGEPLPLVLQAICVFNPARIQTALSLPHLPVYIFYDHRDIYLTYPDSFVQENGTELSRLENQHNINHFRRSFGLTNPTPAVSSQRTAYFLHRFGRS